MKRFIIVAASLALIASAATAEAKAVKKHQPAGGFISQNVGLRSAAPANADFRYGPQPEYPQSLPGGS